MEIFNYSDDELQKMRGKYLEKQERYSQLYNEATERNEKILHHIEKEMLRRSINKDLNKIIDKMDLNE
jgi:trimethylamine:corrinoid methyltransferase-like protein